MWTRKLARSSPFSRIVPWSARSRASLARCSLPRSAATYLNLTPISALESDEPMVRALAPLDRRLSDADLLALDEASQPDPLWRAFHRLRRSQILGNSG